MGKKKEKEGRVTSAIPLRLAPFRIEMGLSQMALAEKLDSSDATVGRIEAGKQNWTQAFLQNAARVLGVHWFDLLPPDGHPLLAAWDALDPVERQAFLQDMKARKRRTA